ncbi:MAG: hypothetical protein ABI869_06540, partial [Actinomycetota bacterium]
VALPRDLRSIEGENMRTVLLYVPALICAGSMIVCVRMMRGHNDGASAKHRDERPSDPRDEEHVS